MSSFSSKSRATVNKPSTTARLLERHFPDFIEELNKCRISPPRKRTKFCCSADCSRMGSSTTLSNAFRSTTLYAIFLEIRSSSHKVQQFHSINFAYFRRLFSIQCFSVIRCVLYHFCTSIYTKTTIVLAVRIASITTTDLTYITI